MGNIKEINIKNQTHYFFNDMINIPNFDPNLLKIDKKLYKNIDIFSDYVKINNVNPLYLIIDEVDGHFEEKNGNYLILDSTDKNKKVLIKYTKLLDGIKNSTEKVNKKLDEYVKKFMKINFNSDDNLPLNETLKLHNITIIIRSVFEDGKYYSQVFLEGYLYEF